MVGRVAWRGLPAVALVLVVAAAGAGASSPIDLPAPVGLGGNPVAVSTDAADPTPITAGLWADTLSGPGAPDAHAHRFRYSRTIKDSTVLVGLVATSPEESGDAVELTVEAADGTLCGSDTTSQRSTLSSAAFGAAVLAASGTIDDRNDPCVQEAVLDITVRRTDAADFDGELPVAIRVVEQAPVTGPEEALPEPPETAVVGVPEPGEPQQLAGGSSFDDAPDLTSGTTVAGTVSEGTERLYRVRLDWGQALAVRVDVPRREGEPEGASPSLDLRLFDPLRNSFDTGHAEVVGTGSYADEPVTLFDGTRPVTYRNRFDGGVVTAPGDYWVSVAVSPAEDREPVEVPVEVTAEVVGEPGGAPTFPRVVSAPDGEAGPDGYDPATPYLVDADTFSADVSGTPRALGAADDDGARRTAGFAVGGVSLVSLLAGVVLLRRRGRVSRAAAS